MVERLPRKHMFEIGPRGIHVQKLPWKTQFRNLPSKLNAGDDFANRFSDFCPRHSRFERKGSKVRLPKRASKFDFGSRPRNTKSPPEVPPSRILTRKFGFESSPFERSPWRRRSFEGEPSSSQTFEAEVSERSFGGRLPRPIFEADFRGRLSRSTFGFGFSSSRLLRSWNTQTAPPTCSMAPPRRRVGRWETRGCTASCARARRR